MVLLSALKMPVAKIAEVTFTSDDRVRDVIDNFNADGFDSLYPKYAGAPAAYLYAAGGPGGQEDRQVQVGRARPPMCGYVGSSPEQMSPDATVLAPGRPIDLFPQYVGMAGMPGSLAGHVGNNPPNRVERALNRYRDRRSEVTGRADRGVAGRDHRVIVSQDLLSTATGWDIHADVAGIIGFPAGNVIAEPVPLGEGQVVDQPEQRGP